MNESIITVITEITKHRDSDVLNRAFLFGVIGLFPVKVISLCQYLPSQNNSQLKQLLNLSKVAEKLSLLDEAEQIQMSDADKACIESNVLVLDENNPKSLNISVSINIDNVISYVLKIEGEYRLKDHISDLEKLIEVYGNFLLVLSDSERDKLTGLFNRRTFDYKLSRLLAAQKKNRNRYLSGEWMGEKRSVDPESFAWLVILDIDHFKRVNDEYGHVAGDEVLLSLSQRMRDCFRGSDLLFRFGGEEFVIILEPIALEMAVNTLERFRNAVSTHQFPLVGQITISIGFAKINEHDFPATILGYSDRALYYAKEHGRDCVYNYEQLIAESKLQPPHDAGEVDLF